MDSILVIFILIFNILDCHGNSLKDQLQKYLDYNRKIELIGRKNLEGLENPYKYKTRRNLDLEDDDLDDSEEYKSYRRLYDFHPGLGATIIGTPSMPGHLPEAEAILPGHTLIRPALGMLKSAVKFPHKDLDNGAGVYGNIDSLGITYDGTGERVLYTGFRRTNRGDSCDDDEDEESEEDVLEEEPNEPRFFIKILRSSSKKRRRPVERAIIDYYKLEQERKRQREENIRQVLEYEKQQPTPFPSIKKGRFKYKKSFENYFNVDEDGDNYEKPVQKVLDDDEDIIYNYLFATPKPEKKPLYYDKDYDKDNDDEGKSYNYVYDRPADFLKPPTKPEKNPFFDDDKEIVKKRPKNKEKKKEQYYQKNNEKENELYYKKTNEKENELYYKKNNEKEHEQNYQKHNDKENEQSYQKTIEKETQKYSPKHLEEDDEYNYLYVTPKSVSELYNEKENDKHRQKDYNDENKTFNFVYARPTAAIPVPVSNYKKDNYGKEKDNDDDNRTFVYARPTETGPKSALEAPMQFKTVLLNGLKIEFVDTSKLSAIGRSGGYSGLPLYKKINIHPHKRRPKYKKITIHPHIRSRGGRPIYAGVSRDFHNKKSVKQYYPPIIPKPAPPKRLIRYVYPSKKTNLRANIIIIS